MPIIDSQVLAYEANTAKRPGTDIRDPLARVFDAWGFDRCLWARTGLVHSQL